MKTYIKDSIFNKAKPKFKQGDRVKVYNFNENPIGTVVCPQYKNNAIYYYVDLYGGEYRALFKEDDLELQKEIAASMGRRKFTKYPSGYVKASAFLPLGDAEAVTHDAMTYLDQGKKVYIDYGALNDVITGYVVDSGDRGSWHRDYDTVYFTTAGGADYFGTKVNLYDYDYVDCEDFEGSLFIHVG